MKRSESVGETYTDSVPAWPALPIRDDAPNVVVILLDDVGFGQLGSYGGTIRTPSIDSLAENGVRYSNFHVTPLCSPTRASLLTGRNHHSVGMGFLAGFDTGFDSYRGHVRSDAATVARMLQSEGYGTYAVGKWHLTPSADMTPSGPFEYWPLNRGFDRYYGFLWGEDDHWSPQLWHDNHAIDPPQTEGYHLSDDLADHAIQFVGEHLSTAPDRPYMLYLSMGAGHAPHQAPKEDIASYAGAFDDGWDEERRRVLARQIELGIVPEGTKLPISNPDVQDWDTLDDDHKRLYVRMNEVYAAYLTHADRAIGRVLDFLKQDDRWANTIVMVLSDNGASGQGGPDGSINEYRHMVGLPDSFADNLEAIDELGGPDTHGHYPAGWAQAGNTPLRYYKKYNYGGGVRAPLIVHWPASGVSGEVRSQFHHVVDVVPTILEACRIEPRDAYDGIEQQPIHGTSMLYTLSDPVAQSRKARQYFEMCGHRGIWSDGWKAVTNHVIGDDYHSESWALYHLDTDYSETTDLSVDRPDVLNDLVDLWWKDAREFHVLPLDDRFQARAQQRGPNAYRTRFRLFSGTRIFSPVSGPNFSDRSFRISAVVNRNRGESGAVLGYGRRAAGFAFYVEDDLLQLEYNRAGARTHLVANEALGEGTYFLELILRRLGPGRAEASLRVDEREVASGELQTMLGGFGGLSVQAGHNSPSTISRYHKPPMILSGLRWVDVEFYDESKRLDIAGDLHNE